MMPGTNVLVTRHVGRGHLKISAGVCRARCFACMFVMVVGDTVGMLFL